LAWPTLPAWAGSTASAPPVKVATTTRRWAPGRTPWTSRGTGHGSAWPRGSPPWPNRSASAAPRPRAGGVRWRRRTHPHQHKFSPDATEELVMCRSKGQGGRRCPSSNREIDAARKRAKRAQQRLQRLKAEGRDEYGDHLAASIAQRHYDLL